MAQWFVTTLQEYIDECRLISINYLILIRVVMDLDLSIGLLNGDF